MAKHFWWCFILLSVFVWDTNGQYGGNYPQSPCPDIFSYEYYDRWYGLLLIPTRANFRNPINLRLKMALNVNLPSAYVGRIELLETKDELDYKLHYGGILRYRVHFPVRRNVPLLEKVQFNNQLICTGRINSNYYPVKIHLTHDLTPTNNNFDLEILEIDPNSPNGVSNPNPGQSSTVNPLISLLNFTGIQLVPLDHNVFGPQTPKAEEAAPVTPETTVSVEIGVCGISKKSLNPLIVGGTSFPRGEWPWLVALFHKNSKGITFVCSGSLVTTAHIITAAHCVLDLKSSKKSFSLVARLGSHDLQDWSDPNDKIVNVMKIEAHPDFSRTNLYNDIAILTIDAIQYTDYIKPVCLWESSNDQSLVVGKSGKVVGWGRDENGQLVTSEPKLVSMPIVSTETCKASSPEFFQYTSENTICAGNRDGVGPCNGDSGGGMFLAVNKRWYIRGIVSNSIRDPSDGTDACSLGNYVIFTDAAKFVPWIKTVINI